MAITAPGIGSGLDVNSIVSQLMAIERQPLDALNQSQSQYNAQLSAYGKIKSDLAAFQSAAQAMQYSTSFSLFSATPSNTSVLTATASSNALPGTHSITVNSLAKPQIQVATTGFADTNTTAVGTVGDTLTFTTGTNTFTVTLNSTNNTLQGLQNAINSATGNYGVTASILNDGTTNGNRLVITANSSGTANAVTLSGTLATSLSFSTTQAATDANLTVDGVTGITKSSNTISDVLQGVTLNLQSTGTSNVTVQTDNAAVTSLANNFVSTYNALQKDISSLHSKGGTLEADNTILTINSVLDNVFNTGTSSGVYNYLSQIGISLQKDGTLALDSATFNSALTSHYSDVVNLFTNTTDGFANRFNTALNSLLQTNGIVTAATDGINANLTMLQDRIDQMQTRLDQTQQSLMAQYSALDAMLGTMQSSANFLMSQLR